MSDVGGMPRISGYGTATSTGSGDVHVVHNHHYGTESIEARTLLEDRRGKAPRQLAADHLERLHQRFVEPPRFGAARGLLATEGAVLIDGGDGSGRTTAARMLLREPAGREAPGELLPSEEGPTRLDASVVEPGARLLLDLSADEQGLWAAVQHELPSFRAELIKRGARVVVVVPERRERRTLDMDLDHLLISIGRPSGEEVLRRHLRLNGIRLGDLPGPLAAHVDSERPMRDIAALANLITRMRVERPHDDVTDWCARALASLESNDGAVARLVDAHRDGSQRSLLLASAMLDGAHEHIVQSAGEKLLVLVGHPKDDVPLLERADLAVRFKELRLEAAPDGRVRFLDPGFGNAVRAHFWSHLPEVRAHLRTWVGALVEDADGAGRHRDAVVGRFVTESLRTEHPEDVAGLVLQWTRSPRREPVRAAARALGFALEDETFGRHFRRQIYEWSRAGSLTEGLTQVLVAVCTDVMAVQHPDEAMVRLHHLARRRAEPGSAADGLLRLVATDKRLHRAMLLRLGRGPLPATARGPSTEVPARKGPRPVDAHLFLALATPQALSDLGYGDRPYLADPEARERLGSGWRSVFEVGEYSLWRGSALAWLSAACTSRRVGGVAVDVLIRAAVGRPDVLARLYRLAREIDRTGAFAARFLARVGAYQGLGSSGSSGSNGAASAESWRDGKGDER